jgi:hypothetical protein
MLGLLSEGRHTMSEPIPERFARSDPNKLDLILLTLQRLQEDLHIAKCQIKTQVREVAGITIITTRR